MYSVSLKNTMLAISIFLIVAGCGKEPVDQSTGDSIAQHIEIAEQPPVLGWLDVALPAEAVAMDAYGNSVWILTTQGYVMKWNSTDAEWSEVQTDSPVMSSDMAFEISAFENGAAVLTQGSLVLLVDGTVTEVPFATGKTPSGICAVGDSAAVLFNDGSVGFAHGASTELVQKVASAEKQVAGSFCSNQGDLAWINTDGTVSRFNIAESLLSETTLPEHIVSVQLSDCDLFADNGTEVYRLSGVDSWEECFTGTITGDNLLYTSRGISTIDAEEVITVGLPGSPEKTCMLDDGTVWSISNGGITVWAEVGSVETSLPEADVKMIRYRMAGQTGSATATGSDIATSEASFGGVFRIYESVSSRPDPFSEFPMSSRDLRRSIAEITIEELHLVGITIDPSSGDQAMVEDANGVAYVLQEGSVLRNNTHIAEITGNEVIIVQEVTVGSEESSGGVTMIPTIFSMRLHEEGGL